MHSLFLTQIFFVVPCLQVAQQGYSGDSVLYMQLSEAITSWVQ